MIYFKKILAFILLSLAMYLSFSQFLMREHTVSKLFALTFFIVSLYIGFEMIKMLFKSNGGESVVPRIYKVLENEEQVFEKLESYFKLGTEQTKSSN